MGFNNMDDSYSVNALKKAAFVDEIKNYIEVQENDPVLDVVKKYLEMRIKELEAKMK
jgi:hypothetical protein